MKMSILKKCIAVALSLVILTGLLGALTGCGTPVNGPRLPQVTRHAHRDALFVQYCTQGPPLYDAQLYQAANAWIASGMAAAPQENSGTVTVSATYIDDQPLAPESNPLTVTVNAVPAYPSAPQLAAEPDPNNYQNPYDYQQDKAKVDQDNAVKTKAYTDAISQIDAQVSAAKQTMQQAAGKLQSLQAPQSSNASVWGCAVAASTRFSEFKGSKVLVMASTMDEKTWDDQLPLSQLHGLSGARVFIIDYQCSSASFCTYKKQTWESVFHGVGVASSTWLDPSATAATDPSVVFTGNTGN